MPYPGLIGVPPTLLVGIMLAKSESAMDDTLTKKIAHLGMIQGVISRMASDAQNLRVLALTLAAAILALGESAGDLAGPVALVALVPTFAFWWMTARHLHIERVYRHLYDKVRRDDAVDPFVMDWRPYRFKVDTIARIAVSQSVLLPFLSVVAMLLFIAWLRWG